MTKVPITVTVDEDLVDELKRRVAAGEAPSASALVVDALRERLRGADMAGLVEEILGDEPLTAEEREWAGRVLAP